MEHYAYTQTGKRVQYVERADHGHNLHWVRTNGELVAVQGSTLVSSTTIIRFYRAMTVAVTIAISLSF